MIDDIPAEARAMIGKETVHYYQVTDRDIRRFAQAIDDPNPIYHNNEYAKNTCHGGIIAPPLLCQMFAYTDAPEKELKGDGSPKEIDVPLSTTRVLGGGSSFEIGEPIHIGDEIKIVKKIADIYKKQGRSGTLFFVQMDNYWTNQNGQMVAHEVATYIHR